MSASLSADMVEAPDRLTIATSLAGQGFPARAYALALEAYNQALCHADEPLLASSGDLLADCCMMTAQYEQGIRFARGARVLWQARGQTAKQAGSAARLALLLSAIGEPEAMSEAESALGLAERGGDVGELVRALDSMSVTQNLLKQADRAVPFSERALALNRAHGMPRLLVLINYAEAIVQAALLAGATGAVLDHAVDQAMTLTREALALARGAGDGWLERLAINNVAEYSLHRGDWATADAILPEFDTATGESTDRCRSHHLLMRGRALLAQRRPAEALEPLLACRRLIIVINDLETTAPCHFDIARAYADLGNFEAAYHSHQAFHHAFVRQASEAAQRRARIYALQREAEEWRAAATEAEMRAKDLTVTNELLAREAERLTRTSMEDPLTGLPNRRQLEMAFLDLLTTGGDFVLAMIDVDHFKQVNDRFSHPVGDAVLRSIGDLLDGCARAEDLVVRYGGEEFALLMRGANLDMADRACERLRHAVQSHDWNALRPGLSVTISIGAAHSSEGTSHDTVVSLADLRLYQAKQGGRNRVISGDVEIDV